MPAREVLTQLEQRGASFFADLVRVTGRLASEVEDGLWELVAAGLVTADGFENLRSLVDPKRRRGEGRGRRAAPPCAPDAGRWSAMRLTCSRRRAGRCVRGPTSGALGCAFSRSLGARKPGSALAGFADGVAPKEAQGEIRGGRFVSGFSGEQFARPEALDLLRAIRRAQSADEHPTVSNADPLNLAGIILPGPRVSTLLRDVVRDSHVEDHPGSICRYGGVWRYPFDTSIDEIVYGSKD